MGFCRAEDSVYADPVRKIQEQLYEQLVVIREGFHQTVAAALSEVNSAASAAHAPTTTGVVSEEKPAVRNEEMEKLRSDNAKLNYRIGHLLRTIDELEAAK